MTYQAMVEDIADNLGNLTDIPIYNDVLDPATFDWNLSGSTRLLRVIRNAEIALASAITPNGQKMYWPHLHKEAYVKPAHYYGTTLSLADNMENPPTTAVFTNDFGNAPTVALYDTASVYVPGQINYFFRNSTFVGSVISIATGTGAGQKRIIVGTDTNDAGMFLVALNKDWTVLPDNTSTFYIYRNAIGFNEVATQLYTGFEDREGYNENIALSTVDQIDVILKIYEMNSGAEIAYGEFSDNYNTALESTPAIPTAWMYKGDKVVFNTLLDPAITLKFEYIAKPRLFVIAQANDATLNRPDFPEQWHDVLIAKCMSNLFLNRLEPDLSQMWEARYKKGLSEIQGSFALFNINSSGKLEV